MKRLWSALKRFRRWPECYAAFGFLALVGVALAQTAPPSPLVLPGAQDLSPYALTANMPVPASTAPPSEAVAPTAGVMSPYARADHVHPRITRATTVTTIANGTFSGTWATALSTAPNLVLTPIYSGAGSVNCFLTSAPTTTTFAGRCTVDQSALLSLSIVTTGLTVGPVASSAGLSVQVIALPPTQ